MNGDLSLINTMITGLKNLTLAENVNVVVCPSLPYLAAFSAQAKNDQLNDNIQLGAQNVSEHLSGAYTGEVSTTMLQELSVKFVIVGHSERRSLYKETNDVVANKVRTTLEAGLTPILCIGESDAERASEQTETILAAQLQAVVDELGIKKFEDVVIAYEPVWAIGTGKTASPEMAQETHRFIRQFLTTACKLSSEINIADKVPLLYGGSVNAANCNELFAQVDIDGGLIGGASLKVDEFKTICSAAKGS
jgi:triosephosphate isomerase